MMINDDDDSGGGGDDDLRDDLGSWLVGPPKYSSEF